MKGAQRALNALHLGEYLQFSPSLNTTLTQNCSEKLKNLSVQQRLNITLFHSLNIKRKLGWLKQLPRLLLFKSLKQNSNNWRRVLCFRLPYKRFQKLLSQGLLPSLVLFPSKCVVELGWVPCHWGLRALPTAKQRHGIMDLSSTLTSASFLIRLMKVLR